MRKRVPRDTGLVGGADQTADGLHGLIARVDEIDRSDHDARITALTELIEHPGALGAGRCRR